MPARPQNEWLTASGIRIEAEKVGYPTTHAQFGRFEGWGLLPEPRDGRYPPETVGRLIEVRKLGEDVRSVPRRVLRLRARHRIPVKKVREAIQWVIPEIRAPRRKLKKFADALRQLPEYDDEIIERAKHLHIGRWAKLVRDADATDLDGILSGLYYFVFMIDAVPWVRESMHKHIPLLEERIVLALVLNLEARRGGNTSLALIKRVYGAHHDAG